MPQVIHFFNLKKTYKDSKKYKISYIPAEIFIKYLNSNILDDIFKNKIENAAH
jgi:hypothetical protein